VQRHRGDRGEQRELGDEEPPAPPAEEGRDVAVEDGRPEELQRIRQRHETEYADRREVAAFHPHPCRERLAREEQR
jgi:hypothetical protein